MSDFLRVKKDKKLKSAVKIKLTFETVYGLYSSTVMNALLQLNDTNSHISVETCQRATDLVLQNGSLMPL